MTQKRVRITAHNRTLEFITDLAESAESEIAIRLRRARDRYPDRILGISVLVEPPFGNGADLDRVVNDLERSGITNFDPRRR